MELEWGMPTLIELNGLKECASLCHTLGLRFMELNMNMPAYQMDCFPEQEALECREKYGIYYTLHLDENLNIADNNPLVAQAYMDTVKWSIGLARRFDMPVINMHMADGIYFTLPNQRVYLFDRYREAYLEKIKAFRLLCEECIQDAGFKICIENCDGFQEFSREAIEYLLDSPVFALTLDIGHSHAAGGTDEDFIRRHIDHLYHMHIHDACDTKNHLALGDGKINIGEKLQLARQQNCRCVLETKTAEALKRSVAYLQS